ncbi:hypothetical protein Tco_0120734 [Tanacetum coccineum]
MRPAPSPSLERTPGHALPENKGYKKNKSVDVLIEFFNDVFSPFVSFFYLLCLIKSRIPTERIGPVAYILRLPQELNDVHDTFHVSNLKKCLADQTLHVPLEKIQVDANLNFVEEPVEILEREFKKLKRSRIHLVKV